MSKKDTITKKVKRNKVIIAIVLAIFILACVLLQYTPLIKIYWLKVIIERIAQNKWNVWFLCIVLIAMHFIEKRMFIEENEKYLEGEETNERY